MIYTVALLSSLGWRGNTLFPLKGNVASQQLPQSVAQSAFVMPRLLSLSLQSPIYHYENVLESRLPNSERWEPGYVSYPGF